MRVLVLCLASTAVSAAQSGPSFEVASIKLAAVEQSTRPTDKGGPGTSSPGQWTATQAMLRGLLYRAWNLKGPANLFSTLDLTARYDIAAKIPAGTSLEDFRLMIRNLLAERLGLVAHIEARELSMLELVIDKGGHKLKPPEPAPSGDPPAFRGTSLDKEGLPQLPPGIPYATTLYGPQGLLVIGRSQGIDGLINQLQNPLGQMVDKTGLTGKYDFRLHCSDQDLALAAGLETPPPTPSRDAMQQCLKWALTAQLGLRVQPGKATVDVLVIEGFHKVPSEN